MSWRRLNKFNLVTSDLPFLNNFVLLSIVEVCIIPLNVLSTRANFSSPAWTARAWIFAHFTFPYSLTQVHFFVHPAIDPVHIFNFAEYFVQGFLFEFQKLFPSRIRAFVWVTDHSVFFFLSLTDIPILTSLNFISKNLNTLVFICSVSGYFVWIYVRPYFPESSTCLLANKIFCIAKSLCMVRWLLLCCYCFSKGYPTRVYHSFVPDLQLVCVWDELLEVPSVHTLLEHTGL